MCEKMTIVIEIMMKVVIILLPTYAVQHNIYEFSEFFKNNFLLRIKKITCVIMYEKSTIEAQQIFIQLFIFISLHVFYAKLVLHTGHSTTFNYLCVL